MSTFGTVVGDRSKAGREEFLRYYSSAISIPSEAVTTVESISKELDIFLVVGIIEKDSGTLYCTAIFIDPTQGLVAKHRKLMPTASERIIWGFGDGSTLPVVEKSLRSNQGAEIFQTVLNWGSSQAPPGFGMNVVDRPVHLRSDRPYDVC